MNANIYEKTKGQSAILYRKFLYTDISKVKWYSSSCKTEADHNYTNFTIKTAPWKTLSGPPKLQMKHDFFLCPFKMCRINDVAFTLQNLKISGLD